MGFANYTEAALRIATNPTFARSLSNGRGAFFLRVPGVQPGVDGIVVFVQNGRLQTMFATTQQYFQNLH